MPKIKTNKAARKRFKITGTGKVLRMKASRRHLLTDKKSGRKRKMRRWASVTARESRMIKKLLGC